MLGILGGRAVAGAFACLILTGAAAQAAGPTASPPDGTYAYVLAKSGQNLGASSVVVKHDAVSVSLHEVETLTNRPSAEVVDESVEPVALTPTAYTASFPINATVTVTAHLNFDPGGAQYTVDGTTGSIDFRLEQGTTHQVVIDGALASGYLLLPSEVKAQGFTSFTDLAPSEPASMVEQVDPDAAPVRPKNVPATDVSLSISGASNFIEWYDPQTMIVDEIDMPAEQVVISRSNH